MAIDLAVRFCSSLAVVLMLGVAREALELEWRFARIDPLTGALNRKAFFGAAEGGTGQTGRVLLVFADVDGLKRLNDKLGHEAGDDALRDFANRIRKAIRKEDLFARIGGDEFVILLKVRDAAAASVVAERLNRVLNLEPPEDVAKLKCSLGILFLPAGSKSIDTELKQADTLMYHAKRERAGLMMAMSINGDIQKLMPFVPETNGLGTKRAAVRSSKRYAEIVAGDSPSEGSLAA
ncbi:MAG: GGDEF domain-containing protein [bacterium]